MMMMMMMMMMIMMMMVMMMMMMAMMMMMMITYSCTCRFIEIDILFLIGCYLRAQIYPTYSCNQSGSQTGPKRVINMFKSRTLRRRRIY